MVLGAIILSVSRQPELGVPRLDRISVRATEDELVQLDWLRGPTTSRSDFIRDLIRQEKSRRSAGVA